MHEREKKRNYLKDCLGQCCHFTLFVVSTDGLIGREAQTTMKKPSAMLAEIWKKPNAEVCGYVTAQMSIAIVRAMHRCHQRGSQVPTGKMSEKLFPQWEDRAGLSLFHQ
jgi:hypothetical protein